MNINDPAWLIERDEKLFFNIVQTTPSYREAMDLLDQAKDHLKNLMVDAKGQQRQAMQNTMSRLSREIKRVNCEFNDRNWFCCSIEVVGREAAEEILARVKNMEVSQGDIQQAV